jgi:hypothetical protein
MSLHDIDDAPPAVALPPQRPPTRAFSMKAAMIVPGLGVLILAVFITAGFLTTNSIQRTTTSTKPYAVTGSSLRAQPAATDLKVIIVSGQPPGNIINAVGIPVGAVRVGHQSNSTAAQEYDAQITLRSDASQGALETFYMQLLKQKGWQIFDTGPAANHPGALEVLAKKAGSDGFYWELGAVVSVTTFGADAPPTGVTRFSLELIQQPDPD